MLIGDLARATATKVETIRYYEREGLIPAPSRTQGNYRSYDAAHLNRLSFIRRARDLGFAIQDIRDLMSLDDDPCPSSSAREKIAADHLEEIDRKTADLQALRGELLKHLDRGRAVIGGAGVIEALAPRAGSR